MSITLANLRKAESVALDIAWLADRLWLRVPCDCGDVACMTTPKTIEKFMELYKAAKKAGQ